MHICNELAGKNMEQEKEEIRGRKMEYDCDGIGRELCLKIIVLRI